MNDNVEVIFWKTQRRSLPKNGYTGTLMKIDGKEITYWTYKLHLSGEINWNQWKQAHLDILALEIIPNSFDLHEGTTHIGIGRIIP